MASSDAIFPLKIGGTGDYLINKGKHKIYGDLKKSYYGIHVPCIGHNLYEIAYQAISLAVREINDRNKIISKIVIRSRLIDSNK